MLDSPIKDSRPPRLTPCVVSGKLPGDVLGLEFPPPKERIWVKFLSKLGPSVSKEMEVSPEDGLEAGGRKCEEEEKEVLAEAGEMASAVRGLFPWAWG